MNENENVCAGRVPGRTVLDDATAIDDDYPRETPSFANVMSHVEQRRVSPATPRVFEKHSSSTALKSTECLIENNETNRISAQCASETNKLPFAARQQPAVFSQRSLHAHRKLLDHAVQFSLIHCIADE